MYRGRPTPALIAVLTLVLMGLAPPLHSQSSIEAADEVLLPPEVIAFPFNSQEYIHRAVSISKENYVWSQKRLQSWARGQGFQVTTDSPEGGYQFQRALLFYAPGFAFRLKAPQGGREFDPYGWELVIDMALLEPREGGRTLSSDFRYYENILRYEIFIDHIHYKTIEIGYGKSEHSPIVVPVPYVRDAEGIVQVEIRIKNHPNSFGMIYDAFLRKSD